MQTAEGDSETLERVAMETVRSAMAEAVQIVTRDSGPPKQCSVACDSACDVIEKETSETDPMLVQAEQDVAETKAREFQRALTSHSLSATHRKLQDVDRGWAWVIMTASFFTNISSGSCYIAFAVFYVEFSDVFQDSGKAVIGFIGSLLMAMALSTMVLHGSLISMWGCRVVCVIGCVIAAAGLILSSFANSIVHLYITYGLVTGTGVGMTFMSSIIIVQQYFVKLRPFAGGVSVIGYSVGSFAMAPLLRWLIDRYAWRGALLLHAAILLHALPFAFLFRPLPRLVKPTSPDRSDVMDEETGEQLPRTRRQKLLGGLRTFGKDVCDLGLFREPKFCLYVLGTYLMSYGMFTFEYHFPSRAVLWGVSPEQASLLSTILGAVSTPCRVVFSLLANVKGMDRPLMYGVCILTSGVVCCAGVLANTYLVMAIVAGLYGASIAGFMSIQATVLSDLLGVERIAKSQGLTCFFFGFSVLKSTPFSGWLFDSTGDYNLPFIVCGLMQTIGGALVCFIPLVVKREMARKIPKVRVESPTSLSDAA